MTPRPGVLFHRQEQLVGVDPGVGDEDLHRAELLLDLGEGGVDLVSRRDVAAHGEELLDGVGPVGDRHPVTRVGEGPGDGQPDAAVAARDQHHPPTVN